MKPVCAESAVKPQSISQSILTTELYVATTLKRCFSARPRIDVDHASVLRA